MTHFTEEHAELHLKSSKEKPFDLTDLTEYELFAVAVINDESIRLHYQNAHPKDYLILEKTYHDVLIKKR